MVQGDIVKRIWSKKSQISEHNDILDIWDTGSHIFERWPNGDELYWKVISREECDNGFTEILEQEAVWKTPGHVIRKEQIPLVRHSASEFQLGSWKIEQVVDRVALINEQKNPIHVNKKPFNKRYAKDLNKSR